MNSTQDINMKYSSLPMLSQQIFLLPGGKARLRVFKSSCLKAISLATKAKGLGLSLPVSESDNNTQSAQELLGCLVIIDDFNLGEDDVLELDVLCRSLVVIKQTKLAKSQVVMANVDKIEHWSQGMNALDNSNDVAASSLKALINQDKVLNTLYKDSVLTNSHWVIARWLELLPVNLNVKRSFINENGFTKAKDFIESIIF